MSGQIISIDIFDGFRVRNLRNEVHLSLRNLRNLRNDDNIIKDSERLLFSKFGDDEEIKDYDFVKDGDSFRVFVKPIESIPSYRLRLTLDNGIICLRNYEGILIQYYGWEVGDRINEFLDTERVTSMPCRNSYENIILEVDIKEDGYEVMKNDITLSIEDDTEYEDDLNDNKKIFDIFFERFLRLDVDEVIHINKDKYEDNDEDNDEDNEYDPEDYVDGDNSWD
jgi:hypothetical protein